MSVLKGILYVVWSKYRFAVLLWFCMMEIHQIKLLYSFCAFEKDFGLGLIRVALLIYPPPTRPLGPLPDPYPIPRGYLIPTGQKIN